MQTAGVQVTLSHVSPFKVAVDMGLDGAVCRQRLHPSSGLTNPINKAWRMKCLQQVIGILRIRMVCEPIIRLCSPSVGSLRKDARKDTLRWVE